MNGGGFPRELRTEPRAVFEGARISAAADGERLRLFARFAFIDLQQRGDERALPSLLAAIEREDIGFVLFQELKFAIEALGGEYEKERDFSNDPAYKKIMAAGGGTDIFGGKKSS